MRYEHVASIPLSCWFIEYWTTRTPTWRENAVSENTLLVWRAEFAIPTVLWTRSEPKNCRSRNMEFDSVCQRYFGNTINPMFEFGQRRSWKNRLRCKLWWMGYDEMEKSLTEKWYTDTNRDIDIVLSISEENGTKDDERKKSTCERTTNMKYWRCMTETKEHASNEKKLNRTAIEKAERAKCDGATWNKKCEFMFIKLRRVYTHPHSLTPTTIVYIWYNESPQMKHTHKKEARMNMKWRENSPWDGKVELPATRTAAALEFVAEATAASSSTTTTTTAQAVNSAKKTCRWKARLSYN